MPDEAEKSVRSLKASVGFSGCSKETIVRNKHGYILSCIVEKLEAKIGCIIFLVVWNMFYFSIYWE